jgi:hypothetical protein
MTSECRDLIRTVTCNLPDANGERCGQPASPLLPVGICSVHGLQLWAYIHSVINTRVIEALAAPEPVSTAHSQVGTARTPSGDVVCGR